MSPRDRAAQLGLGLGQVATGGVDRRFVGIDVGLHFLETHVVGAAALAGNTRATMTGGNPSTLLFLLASLLRSSEIVQLRGQRVDLAFCVGKR